MATPMALVTAPSPSHPPAVDCSLAMPAVAPSSHARAVADQLLHSGQGQLPEFRRHGPSPPPPACRCRRRTDATSSPRSTPPTQVVGGQHAVVPSWDPPSAACLWRVASLRGTCLAPDFRSGCTFSCDHRDRFLPRSVARRKHS